MAKDDKKKSADDEKPKTEAEAGEGAEGDAAAAPAKKGGGKKMIMMIGAAVLLLAAAGIGVWQSGLLGGDKTAASDDEHAADAEAPKRDPSKAVFINIPDMLVNIQGTGRRQSFLKLTLSLEIDNAEDAKIVEAVMPRVMDQFQVYLRELRVEDLQGTAGVYRLREELLRRVNVATAPVKVHDVLFKEMLVQ